MTPLEKAYAQLKKEAAFLRCENKKLKEGTYVDADRKANEDEIRKLKRALERMTREKERYHELWRKCRLGLDGDSMSEINSLKRQLEEANAVIAKLKAQMNRDHENSSIPSSQKPFHKKIKNSREKTARKPGGQSGHSGHKRPKLEPTVPVIELEPDPSIINNPDFYNYFVNCLINYSFYHLQDFLLLHFFPFIFLMFNFMDS